MLRVLALVLLITGCKQVFGITDPVRLTPDAYAVDAAIPCTDNDACPASAPHCATGQGICVECLGSDHCVTGQLCDPDTRTCRACLRHTDCASNVCLPDGECGDDSTVIHVNPAGTDGGDCVALQPCATLPYAMNKVTAQRKFVKLSGAFAVTNRVHAEAGQVVWLADPGTTLTSNIDPIVELKSGVLTIYDLTIVGGNNAQAFRILTAGTLVLRRSRLTGFGKVAINGNGGFLSVERCMIDDNPGGGILTNSSTGFSITNTFLVRNGNGANSLGAAKLDASTAGQNRFELNTVVDNRANTGGTAARTGGVECSMQNTLSMPYNIIARNTGFRSNTHGGCDFSKSIVTDDILPLAFVSPDEMPFDYHLGAGSVAIDAAAVTSQSVDYDGDSRPHGAASDVGADEYTP